MEYAQRESISLGTSIHLSGQQMSTPEAVFFRSSCEDLLHVDLSEYFIHPLGPYSVQSISPAKAVSWAIGHKAEQVITPTQDTQMAHSSQQAGTHFANLRRMTGWINPIWN